MVRQSHRQSYFGGPDGNGYCGVTYYTQIFIFATPSYSCADGLNKTKSYKDDNLDCEDGWIYDYSIIFEGF